jgi:MADS-box transcription factor
MSWERSGGDNRADMSDMFGSGGGTGGGGSGQATSPLGVGISGMAGNKRRVGSEVEDPALATSPGSLGGIGSDKKELKPEGGG